MTDAHAGVPYPGRVHHGGRDPGDQQEGDLYGALCRFSMLCRRFIVAQRPDLDKRMFRELRASDLLYWLCCTHVGNLVVLQVILERLAELDRIET